MCRTSRSPGDEVKLSRARSTKALIILYYQLDSDPSIPWMTVCDTHGYCMGHSTRRDAEAWMVEPEMWCDGCREIVATK